MSAVLVSKLKLEMPTAAGRRLTRTDSGCR